MTKRNKILIALLFIVAVIIAFIVGQIFAKHATKIIGGGTGKISKWSFKVNGEEENIKTINLISSKEREISNVRKIRARNFRIF